MKESLIKLGKEMAIALPLIVIVVSYLHICFLHCALYAAYNKIDNLESRIVQLENSEEI